MKKPPPITPLEQLVIDHFVTKGGTFESDADDLYCRLNGERRVITRPFGAAPFFVFDQQSMCRTELRVIRRALLKAARERCGR